jgi:hypothetical protein
MIRKLASGKYRLYSRKKNPKTGKRRTYLMVARATATLRSPARCSGGTFDSRKAAEKHEHEVQYFKRH